MKRFFGSQSPSLPPVAARPPAKTASTDRTLIVGNGIVLAGEIKDCDCLVVEGRVQAEVSCRELKIASGGLFMGTAAVINAEVIGRFEGELKATERLVVRAGGNVSGEVRYERIEIERGGQISGHVEAGSVTEPRNTRGQRLSA